MHVTEWRADPPRYGDAERRDMQVVESKLNALLHLPDTPLPDRKAPVSRILTDRTGFVWVQLTTTADRIPDEELPTNNDVVPPIKWRDRDKWAAIDRDGVVQFTIELPKGVTLLDRVGHRLLGVAANADGSESIVVWQVTQGGKP